MNVEQYPSPSGQIARRWYQHLAAESREWEVLDRCIDLRFPLRANLRTADGVRTAGAAFKAKAVSVQTRHRSSRAVIKDPFLLFSCVEFARRYDAPVIVSVRGPHGFVSSLLRLNWRFDFNEFVAQPSLMSGPLAAYAKEIRQAAATPLPALEEACLLWRVLNGYIGTLRDADPRVHVAIYERLVADVPAGVVELFDIAQLKLTPAAHTKMQRYLRAGSAPRDVIDPRRDPCDAAVRWKSHLSTSDTTLISRLTEPEFRQLYGDTEVPGETR